MNLNQTQLFFTAIMIDSAFTIKGNVQLFIIVFRIFIAPRRKRISKNGLQMCTRHILTVSASFSARPGDAPAKRTDG